MADNPGRYDYKKAQVRDEFDLSVHLLQTIVFKTFTHVQLKVPGPLTAKLESKHLEKKKAQKVLRKQRDKEQKEEKKKQELEADEKKRFASLTDREKVS